MDENSCDALSKIFLAARVWRFFGEPEPTRRGARIRWSTRRASSNSHFSGRIPRAAAQTQHWVRRTICVGL